MPAAQNTDAYFSHEKPEACRKSVGIIAWRSPFIESLSRVGDVKEQLDSASTSIAFNIAEGNGKFTPNDRCRFLDIAHGSTLECAAGLDILVAKGKLTAVPIRPGKEQLLGIVRMLMGLLKSGSDRDYKKGGAAQGSNSSGSND